MDKFDTNWLDSFSKDIKSNKQNFETEYSGILNILKNSLNSQYYLQKHYTWSLGKGFSKGRLSTERVIFSSIHKNLYNFASIIELTKHGLYGPACNLLRSIFESLMLAKFSSISIVPTTTEEWLDGKYIPLKNRVLKKITKPVPEQLNHFWSSLNELSHATIYSSQVSHEYQEIKEKMNLNLQLCLILLQFNGHLLKQHWITPSVDYYTKRYRKEGNLSEAKRQCSLSSRNSRMLLNKSSKKLIREYCAKWQLKT